MTKQKPKFKRTDAVKYSKLGVRRKKLQKYRKPRGRDNKLRLNMKGHTRKVKIGFRSPKSTRYKIKEKQPILVHNLQELKQIKESQIPILAKIGARKKKEIAEYAKEKKIEILNLKPEEFLKKLEEKIKQSKEKKNKLEEKKKEREKKEKQKEEKKDEKSEKPKEKTETKEATKKETQPKETQPKPNKEEGKWTHHYIWETLKEI